MTTRRRLKTMTTEREPHLTLWNVGSQQIQVAFDGGGSEPGSLVQNGARCGRLV
jgi:hypothetical protein